MAVPPEVAAEMLQLCRAIPKHPSKTLKRLAASDAPRHRSVTKNCNQAVFLKHALPSQRVVEGRDRREDRLHELVKTCGILFDHLQLSGPNLVCAPHRDGKNSSSLSYICFLGDYEGGALCLEDGTRFEARNVWHSFNGRDVTHWNEEVTSGQKFALVAYSSSRAQQVPGQPSAGPVDPTEEDKARPGPECAEG